MKTYTYDSGIKTKLQQTTMNATLNYQSNDETHADCANTDIIEPVVSFINQIPRFKRVRILYKVLYYIQIGNAKKQCRVRNHSANSNAFEFLRLPNNVNKYVKVRDVSEYCNVKHKEKTGNPLGDPPRGFEMLRKDKLPLEWSEIRYYQILYVKYAPQNKTKITDKIIDDNRHRSDNFKPEIIAEKIRLANYKCSITGIPQDNGDLAADHFIPKEKGGLSDYGNCIIINKILNEKKNKKQPIEWFCETLLTNFMNICKSVGILQECKEKLIKFIEDF